MSKFLGNPVNSANRYLLLLCLLQGKLEFSHQFNLLFLINFSSAFCMYRSVVQFLTHVTLVKTSNMDDGCFRCGFVFDGAKI